MIWTLLFIVNIMSTNFAGKNNMDCKLMPTGVKYYGNLSYTFSQFKCQSWKETLPHFHIGTYNESFKDYCRNPTLYSEGVWCFTYSPLIRWQYCAIPFCKEVNCNLGVSYSGNLSATIKGFKCLPWSRSPQMFWNFPEMSLQNAKSYCRNPNFYLQGPWCYINEPNYTQIEACFRDYCDTNSDLNCPRYDTLLGPMNIIIEGGSLCPTPCLITMNYNDSDPRIQFPQIKFNYTLLTSYSDFVFDFNFSVSAIKLFHAEIQIKESRYNFFLCVNKSEWYLSDEEDCVFTIYCVNNVLIQKPPTFLIRSLSEICFIYNEDLTTCLQVSLIKHPPGYVFVPDTNRQMNRENDELFFINIFKMNNFIRNIPVPKVKEIVTSATSCVSILQYSNNISITLNTVISCNCRYLSYIHVGIILDKFEWMVIERGYNFNYEDEGIKCNLIPYFQSKDSPIIVKENKLFSFKVPEYGLNFIFTNPTMKRCLTEKNVDNFSFHLESNRCCFPICHIILDVWLLRYDGLNNLGTYYIINIYENILTFKPNLVIILYRERNITCEILNTIAHIGISKTLYLIYDDGSENEISYYELKGYVDKFKLKCLCSVDYYNYNVTVILDTIIREFKIVKKFNALIQWNLVLKVNESINCTVKETAAPDSIKLIWDVRRTNSFYDDNYIVKNLSKLNVLVLTFPITYEIGKLTALCIASVEDYLDDHYYTFTTYDWIHTDLKGQDGQLIYPTYRIVQVPDTIGCYHPETAICQINITRISGVTNFIFDRCIFEVTPELRSGLYRIICKFTLDVGYIITPAIKLFFNRNIFFYPNLSFYILNKHGNIKCVQDRDSLVSAMRTKLVLEAKNLSKEALLYQDGFLYFTMTHPGVVELKCILIVVEETIIPNIPKNAFPYVKKDVIISSVIKEVSLIAPFKLYILESSNHFINETITCRSNSPFLLLHSYIFKVRWEVFPYIKYHFFNYTTTTIYFPSTTPPDTYYIKCSFDYEVFTWMIVKESISAETTIQLTAVIAFVIQPNRSVFIERETICCMISAFVEIYLIMVYNGTTSESDVTICKTLPSHFVSRADTIFCEIEYNQRQLFISRKVLYLAQPHRLYIIPDVITLDTDIICFPYMNVFSVDKYNDVSFSILLLVVKQPINQIIMDVVKDYNISLFTSTNGVLKLNLFLNSFGWYMFNCSANITILNQTYTFYVERSVKISGYSEDIDSSNKLNYEPYLLIGMITSLHCIFFPLLLIIISVAIIIHDAHVNRIIQTLKSIGYDFRTKKKSTVEKDKQRFFSSKDSIFPELFKIVYAYSYLIRINREDEKERLDYNRIQPDTGRIEASLRTCFSSLSDMSYEKENKMKEYFQIMSNLNKIAIRDYSSELMSHQLASIKKESTVSSDSEADDLWHPEKKKMITYDGILPARLLEKRKKLVEGFKLLQEQKEVEFRHLRHNKDTLLTRKTMKLKPISPHSKMSASKFDWDDVTKKKSELMSIKETKTEDFSEYQTIESSKSSKESTEDEKPQRKILRFVGLNFKNH